MSDVTRTFTAIEQGRLGSLGEIVPSVFNEVRRMDDVSVATAQIPFLLCMHLTP